MALAVSESTVRRWCDTHSIRSIRTSGGHRRIPLTEVIAFARSNQLVVSESQLLGCGMTKLQESDGQIFEKRFLDHLATGKRGLVIDSLRSLFLRGKLIEDILDEVVAPAMSGIGRLWEAEEITVADERRACQIMSSAFYELQSLMPLPKSNAPLAAGGTPGNDHAELGTRMVELTLISRGWRTHQCGAGIPMRDLSLAMQKVSPDLLWLSLIHIEDEETLLTDYTAWMEPLRKAGTPIVIGGRAISVELTRRLDYSYRGYSMKDLADFSSRLWSSFNHEVLV